MQARTAGSPVASIGALVAVLLSIIALWEKLGPPLSGLFALLTVAGACAFVLVRRKGSLVLENGRNPVYPRVMRISAALLLLTVIGYLLLGWPRAAWRYYRAPTISGIEPSEPIAGSVLEIRGSHLPHRPGGGVVRLGSTALDRFLSASGERIEALVPSGATSGPLVVEQPGTLFGLLPALAARHPVPRVRPAEPLLLVDEEIRPGMDSLAVAFALLNTTPDQRITAYDIRLYTLLAVDKLTPFIERRVDLGSFDVRSQLASGERTLASGDLSLLDGTSVVTLAPGESNSFRFRLTRPRGSHEYRFVFAVYGRFRGPTGLRGTAFLPRAYQIDVDDLRGFTVTDSIPLTRASLRGLRARYPGRVRVPAELSG